MLSLQKFKSYLEFLKDYETKLYNAEDAVTAISSDFTGVAGIAHPLIDQYIKLLIDAMELADKDEELLWWWIYDCDWGKDHTNIYNKKNEVIDCLDTIDKLYNYIYNLHSLKTKEKK